MNTLKIYRLLSGLDVRHFENTNNEKIIQIRYKKNGIDI